MIENGLFRKLLESNLGGTVNIERLEDIYKVINTNSPKIHIEQNPGQIKDSWGKEGLPFYYGELPDFINPSDGMGWDIIIPRSVEEPFTNMKVAGLVKYVDERLDKKGNHKIIIAPNGIVSENDKNEILSFFSKRDYIVTPEFFDNNENLEEKRTWETSTFKQHKLTRVKDGDYVGMGVGDVARRHFYGNYKK